MNTVKDNIGFLKNIIKKRETYIRFSPLGTALVGLMGIGLYFYARSSGTLFWMSVEGVGTFLLVGWIGILLVTILSLFNSDSKGEELLPKPIRYIIINLLFFGVAFSAITWVIYENTPVFVIPIFLILYGLLIVVSRFCIPSFLKYFGFIVFIAGVLAIDPLIGYIGEIVLVLFGLGHLVMALLLKINNDKNG